MSSASTSLKVYSVTSPKVFSSSSSVASTSSIASFSSKIPLEYSSKHRCPFNETPMEGISRCSYNFCDPEVCFHLLTPENLSNSCNESCEEDHPHKHFCNCGGPSEEISLVHKIVENSVEIESNLVKKVNDDGKNVVNMEENDDDEDLTRELNKLHGFLDEDLEKRLRNWDEKWKALGIQLEEASSMFPWFLRN